MVTAIQTLTFTRTVSVPPAAAYRAFTEEKALREWLCDVAQVNARRDGYLFLAWNRGHQVMGVFKTLEENRQVVVTWQGRGEPQAAQVTATFEAQNGGTLVTIAHDGVEDSKTAAQVTELWKTALENLQSVLETGQDLRITRRPMLGIFLDQLTSKRASELGVPVTEGILLTGVAEGMGAQAAGLDKQDVIVSMEGKPITDYPSLSTAITGRKAGDKVEVGFYRGAEKRTVSMELSRRSLPDVPSTAEGLAEKLETQYAQLENEPKAVFEGVSEAETTQRPAPQEWSAKETVAHLIGNERRIQDWIGTLVDEGPELNGYSANLFHRAAALAATYPTTAEVLAELKRSREETIMLLRLLPETFVANKGSYNRMGISLLTSDAHDREHFGQMRAARK